MGRVDIFGVKFDNLNIAQISDKLLAVIRESGDRQGMQPCVLFTPNPEIVLAAQEDRELMNALSFADIISADGVGIVWASKYFGKQIKERASGYDIVQELFKKGSDSGGIVAFFLGGSEASVSGAARNMMARYDGLNVCGIRNGYFGSDENDSILSQINESNPDLLLVGLGSPKQEKWVADNAEGICARVIIVVGGSFDVMSGNLKRAPEIFQRFGLEWLYRLIKQPKRLFRMMKLPLFVIKVLWESPKKKPRRKNGRRKKKRTKAQ